MLRWHAEKHPPEDGEDETQRSCHDECRLPAVGDLDEDHQRRRQHGAERRAGVEEASGDRAFLSGEPDGYRLHACRNGRGLGDAQQAAEEGER